MRHDRPSQHDGHCAIDLQQVSRITGGLKWATTERKSSEKTIMAKGDRAVESSEDGVSKDRMPATDADNA